MPRSSFFSSDGRIDATIQQMADDVVTWVHSAFQRHLQRNSWMARSAASRMVPSGSSDWLVWSDRCVHSMNVSRFSVGRPASRERRSSETAVRNHRADRGAPPSRCCDQLTADGANGILPIGDPRGRKEWVEDRAYRVCSGGRIRSGSSCSRSRIRVREATA